MTAISIRQFAGISPRTPVRYLQDAQAQTALNCDVFAGSLKPINDIGSAVATLTKSGTPLTIYRFGQDTVSDANYWFHWTTDVDVARSQIPSDTSEWTFYTDGVQPKATYAALALSGSGYPTVSRPLGLPAPVTGPSVSASPADDSLLIESRVYTYTYVSKESGYEFESAPAPASAVVAVNDGQAVTVGSFATPPAGYNVTHRRLYRSVSGTFLYIGEITVATTSFSDTVVAADLGEEIPTTTWLPPPATLKGLTNLPNGIMAGFTGRDVYFCEPYTPHAWPLQYMQSLDFPVVGLGRSDTTLVVLTTGTPYFIQGSHPDSMTVVKADMEQSCASKRSIVSINGVVIYASPDGLVQLSPGGSKLITERTFTRAQWQSQFLPTSIHAYASELKYVGFYNNGATSGGFVYDLITGELTVNTIYATAGYNDLLTDKLYLAFADRSVKIWSSGVALPLTWKSKKFSLPQEMALACGQLEADVYPMTLKIYGNGSLIHTQTVGNRNPFRLPPGKYRDWEVQVEGYNEVFAVALAHSPGELAGV